MMMATGTEGGMMESSMDAGAKAPVLEGAEYSGEVPDFKPLHDKPFIDKTVQKRPSPHCLFRASMLF
jgi:hypothetical protein